MMTVRPSIEIWKWADSVTKWITNPDSALNGPIWDGIYCETIKFRHVFISVIWPNKRQPKKSQHRIYWLNRKTSIFLLFWYFKQWDGHWSPIETWCTYFNWWCSMIHQPCLATSPETHEPKEEEYISIQFLTGQFIHFYLFTKAARFA